MVLDDHATDRPLNVFRPITGTRSALRVRAMAATPLPSRASSKIRRTVSAAAGSAVNFPSASLTQPGRRRVTTRVAASRCFRAHAAPTRSDFAADSE